MELQDGGEGSAGQGRPPSGQEPDVTMGMSDSDFVAMFTGQLDATSAFMSGKLKIKGNMALAMKLQKLVKTLPKGGAAAAGGGGERC